MAMAWEAIAGALAWLWSDSNKCPWLDGAALSISQHLADAQGSSAVITCEQRSIGASEPTGGML